MWSSGEICFLLRVHKALIVFTLFPLRFILNPTKFEYFLIISNVRIYQKRKLLSTVSLDENSKDLLLRWRTIFVPLWTPSASAISYIPVPSEIQQYPFDPTVADLE